MNDFQNEYVAINKELMNQCKQLEEYPKGSLRRRVIKNKEYYYLQYREGKHVKSRYVHADEVAAILNMIEERKKLKKNIREMQARLEKYARLLGVHRSYRPVKDVDYKDYTLFMSMVAHDYKTLELDLFMKKYDVSKYRGINKRYIAGFLDYISGIDRGNVRKTNDLVLDPYTYLMYFKYGNKDIIMQEVKKAIPAFLNRGLLITDVQEAVGGTSRWERVFV